MKVNFGTKTKFIPLDLHFGLVAKLGYQLLKLGNPKKFLVFSDHWATTTWYILL